jgi:hypothetical protein
MTVFNFQSGDARMPVAASIPLFEGRAVEHTRARIVSVGRLDVGDAVYRVDETVKILVECRVDGIDHKVNTDGDLERVHLLKAIDAVPVAWDMDLEALRKALES